jgi:hypothetical protein
MTNRTVWLVGLALTIAGTSAAAAPCAGFTDVEDTNAFCPHVAWLRNRSITLGCTATLYCPSDPVTRLQMAAFMHRLGDALFPLTCAPGQGMKWNGVSWECADDEIGGGGGGGTVTSVAAGTGLQASPNPITGAGAINVASSYQLPQGCGNGQVAKSNGAGAWGCASDSDTNSGGTVTSITAGTGLVGGTITGSGTLVVDATYVQRRVVQSCLAGSSIRAIAADGSVSCETDSGTNAFVQGGNAFGGPGALGTSDDNRLDLRAGNRRVMRYEPDPASPNVIGGSPENSVTAGVRGATIAGSGAAAGSDPDLVDAEPNVVRVHYGTIGGGFDNQAGGAGASTVFYRGSTVSGGLHNTASAYAATVGGGANNTASGPNVVNGGASTVGGGTFNTASMSFATVGGGNGNEASTWYATVSGGESNEASGFASAVGGGANNLASGDFSVVAGGSFNAAAGDHAVAFGRRAKANHTGAFVYADSKDFDFPSGSNDSFRVRASGGGVRFVVQINADGSIAADCLLNSATGGWNCSSDRNLKNLLYRLDGKAVLATLATVPIFAWSAKAAASPARHFGPTAQDFRAAFGLGDSDLHIGQQDADGVALAAIQGLNEKLEAKLADLTREIAALRELVQGPSPNRR